MANPFEDENRNYHVLVNDENQHSLWPSWIAVPDGWQSVLSDRPRPECLAYVEEHWTDLRPASLTRV